MQIGSLKAEPGTRVFGSLKSGETHGRFAVEIPLHILRGARPGPVLVVQAGVSGLEIEPAMMLPHVLDEIDLQQLRGTLVMVPMLNTSGFEFEQIHAIWDDKHLNQLGRGNGQGTISEQLIACYYREVLAQADALIDIRTGAQWGYYRYAGVYETGQVERSQALATALGLPQVLLGQPQDQSMAYELARDGKAVVMAWIGGGPGLRDYRSEDMQRIRLAVLNALRQLAMTDGAPELPEAVQVLRAHSILYARGERGLSFMEYQRRGSFVEAGTSIGIIRHPYTGETLETIVAPRSGVLLHAGAVWPMHPDDVPLAILGDPLEK